ncbi:preprotein translocase subunit SecE [Candidatus Peregrinibacteria bacterium]|nr:preprotein translocase subunit SecE [Candidatus Peregrinibacteria bacterium]
MSIRTYLRESFQELHMVTWPTKKQAIRITIIVFFFVIFSALLLGLIDQILATIYQRFI